MVLFSLFVFIFMLFLFWMYFCYKTIDKYFNIRINENIYNNYDKITVILRDSEDIAFRSVYYGDVLVYHTDFKKLSNKETEEFGKKYARLVLDLCGKDIEEKLKSIYGYDAILMRLLISFKLKCVKLEEERVNSLLGNNISEEASMYNFLKGER